MFRRIERREMEEEEAGRVERGLRAPARAEEGSSRLRASAGTVAAARALAASAASAQEEAVAVAGPAVTRQGCRSR